MSEETFTEGTNNLASKNDGTLALIILVATVVIVVIVYLLRRKSTTTDNSWKQTSFTPPVERAEFMAAKEKLDPRKVADLDELKKLLMRRAIQTIPILLQLQNEGSSIDRLYKRGMLTDDMHFKVKELKAFVDKEFQDVQFEADDLLEGWGQHIWPQAMQFHQMILKQAEAKNEEQRAVEDEKKKTETQKRKDKEKAKKQAAAQDSDAPSNSAVASSSSSAAAAAGSSTPASGTAPGSSPAAKPVRVPRVIRPVDPEELKIQDAERMAQQLLEEEEREQKKSGTKKGGKK